MAPNDGGGHILGCNTRDDVDRNDDDNEGRNEGDDNVGHDDAHSTKGRNTKDCTNNCIPMGQNTKDRSNNSMGYPRIC